MLQLFARTDKLIRCFFCSYIVISLIPGPPKCARSTDIIKRSTWTKYIWPFLVVHDRRVCRDLMQLLFEKRVGAHPNTAARHYTDAFPMCVFVLKLIQLRQIVRNKWKRCTIYTGEEKLIKLTIIQPSGDR